MNRKYIFLGLFLVISLGMLMWLAVNIGAIGGSKGKLYRVKLDHAAGLVKDNAVKIAGVKVGKVAAVKVEHKTAVLELRVDPEVELHADAEAIVRAKSLLGEKYLQLDPGSLEAAVLPDGAELTKVRTVFEIDEMLNALQPILGGEESIGAMVQPLVKRLDNMLAAANGDDGGPPLATRDDLRKSIEDIRVSIETTKRMIENFEGPLNELLAESNELVGDPRIRRTIGNVDKIAATTAEHLPTLLAKTEKALDAVNRVADELTPERMEKLGQILDEAQLATSNLRKVSEELVGLTGDLAPMISHLKIIAARAATIDEHIIRQFIQKEGMRVNLQVPKNARDRIEELEKAN
jgi:phospholipid/cholesterol/gamma-HCH transport system substrate-binding protein